MKALLTVLAPCLILAAQERPAVPNVVLLLIDDLGYGDVGAFGSKLNRTPHIDRMAAEGRKLTSFYVAPVCTPSRASFMTGCPRRVGLPNVLFPGAGVGLNPQEKTLPEVLQEKGYASLCVGKWHLGDQPEFLPTRHGFDHYFGIPYSNDMGPAADGARGPSAPEAKGGRGHPPIPLLRDGKVVRRVLIPDQEGITEEYTEEAVRFLREQKNRPFFLYLPHTAVHFPVYPGPRFKGKSGKGSYTDWVEEVDASVGRVLDTLRELKLAERTFVFFTSDNGGTGRAVNAPLRGGKASTWEGGMRAPAIAWWPGRIPPGTSTDALTTNMDLLPTVARLAGAEPPGSIDGKDIWPLLAGEPGASSPHECFFYYRGTALEAVRSGPWKLALQGGKLFNLEKDLGESTDVASEQPEVVKRLRSLAERARADLGDGAKAGPGCRPPGRVEKPAPILDREGNVRPEFRSN